MVNTEGKGKAAIVTGGASGIGRALVAKLASQGMRVGIFDVNRDRLDEVADEVPGCIALEVDVSDPDAVDAAARRCLQELGPPAVLCANAGMAGAMSNRLWELTPAAWGPGLGVNLMGPVNCLRSFLPAMLEAGEGHVVITASMAAITPRESMPVYTAAKHAVLAVAEVLRLQLESAELPIGVSVLLPSAVLSNFFESKEAGTDRHQHSGLEPAQIAESVARAIDRKQFYIFTHAESRESVEAWYAGITNAYDAMDGVLPIDAGGASGPEIHRQ